MEGGERERGKRKWRRKKRKRRKRVVLCREKGKYTSTRGKKISTYLEKGEKGGWQRRGERG